MKNVDTRKLISILRQLAKLMASETQRSEQNINAAKNLATRLYILHSKRKISLKEEEFQIVLDVIEFDPSL